MVISAAVGSLAAVSSSHLLLGCPHASGITPFLSKDSLADRCCHAWWKPLLHHHRITLLCSPNLHDTLSCCWLHLQASTSTTASFGTTQFNCSTTVDIPTTAIHPAVSERAKAGLGRVSRTHLDPHTLV